MAHKIHETQTLGEIVARHPETRRVFERHGLDFCCRGARTLTAAVADNGLDMTGVFRDLDAACASPPSGETGAAMDWTRAPLADLAAHIVRLHHAYLKEVLPKLAGLFEKVIRAHGARHGEMLQPLRAAFIGLKDELEPHLMKEERVLFPLMDVMEEYVRGKAPRPDIHCGSVRRPIRQMEHEHDLAGEALAGMRRLTADYRLPADACPTFSSLYENLRQMEADLHQHIHLENNILFPRAIALEDSLPGIASPAGG